MDVQTRILAGLEIFGGVTLCVIVALLGWNSVGEFSLMMLASILLFLAFSLYGLAAGVGLWRYTTWGWRHSKIIQILSIVVVSIPQFSYNVFLGGQAIIGFFGSSLIVNFNLGGTSEFSIGEAAAPYGIGINVIAVWGLIALLTQQPPDAIESDKIQQSND